MTAIEDAAERAVAAVILFGDLDTAADVRDAAKAIARNVITEVEPLIRADERSYSRTAAGVRRDAEAKWVDLRAQVALHEQRARMLVTNAGTGPLWLATADAYADVLDMIDGSNA